jgi:uncharacterized coiled-coil protein SlyX
MDWEPIYHHGATTDSTLVPLSRSSWTCINPIGHALCRVFLPSEVSDLIREGLQLGAQQRAEEEHLAALWQRVHKARTQVEERLNREERLPPHYPPFPNLVPCRWFRGTPPRPFLHNHIAPLRPRETLRLPARFRQTSLVTSCIVPTICRVSHFKAPIHVPPRPRNPSPQPPPPYVRGTHVILEEETDESVSDSN